MEPTSRERTPSLPCCELTAGPQTGVGMMAGNRHSADAEERIEWQLDQIRVNTLVVGLFFGLILIGVVISAIGGVS